MGVKGRDQTSGCLRVGQKAGKRGDSALGGLNATRVPAAQVFCRRDGGGTGRTEPTASPKRGRNQGGKNKRGWVRGLNWSQFGWVSFLFSSFFHKGGKKANRFVGYTSYGGTCPLVSRQGTKVRWKSQTCPRFCHTKGVTWGGPLPDKKSTELWFLSNQRGKTTASVT